MTYRGPRYLDRSVALETGEVAPEGIDLRVSATPSIGGAFQAIADGEVDLAEVLLGEYVALLGRGGTDLVGLPVFLTRRFAQRWLWVARDGDLTDLAQLKGKRLGWPSRAAGALGWVLGLLRDGASLAPGDVEFVWGRLGGGLAPILDGPPPASVADDPDGATLPDRLASGDVDCVVSPYPLASDSVRLLLADPGAHERDHVRAGHGLPILSLVVMRRAVYEADRWTACSVVDAFAAAKALGARRLNYLGALAVGLPWLSTMLEEVDELFGGDAFPYGVSANHRLLEDYLDLAVVTRLSERRVAIDELFAAEVLAHPGVPDTTAYDVPMRGTRQEVLT